MYKAVVRMLGITTNSITKYYQIPSVFKSVNCILVKIYYKDNTYMLHKFDSNFIEIVCIMRKKSSPQQIILPQEAWTNNLYGVQTQRNAHLVPVWVYVQAFERSCVTGVSSTTSIWVQLCGLVEPKYSITVKHIQRPICTLLSLLYKAYIL